MIPASMHGNDWRYPVVLGHRAVLLFLLGLSFLLHALVHRDLPMRDIRTRINVYENAIEFINPRRTNGFSPPAWRAIRYGITQRA